MIFPRLYGRLLIALPGIALFLVILLELPPKWGLFLFSALAVLSAWEAVQLGCSGGLGVFPRTLISLLAGISTLVTALEHPLAMPMILLPGAVVALSVMAKSGSSHAIRRIAGTSALVSLYAMGFGIMGRLLLSAGPWMVLAVLALCWIGDSAAYFTGVALGKHKLMPSVSPKKSWEGFIGGLFGAVAGCVLVGGYGGIPLLPLFVTGFAGGVAGVLGDLFESSLKRDAGVKDSSGLLLGHGGILDRFDSTVVAAPAALTVLTLFGLIH